MNGWGGGGFACSTLTCSQGVPELARPGVPEKRPAGHRPHVCEPAVEYDPAAQLEHAVREVEAVVVENFPEAQSLWEGWLVSGDKVPTRANKKGR